MNLYDIKVIKPLLTSHGFHFSKSLGQNFLISEEVTDKIIKHADIDKSDCVVEIGPGIGALTQKLSIAARKICAIELDKKLLPLLNETLAEFDNICIINANALKIDFPTLCHKQFTDFSKPVLCANLPYNITTPALSAVIDSDCFSRICVMIQREVAERICASPGSSEYGAFTVYANYHTVPNILFNVPPSCFLPRPSVTSSVILLKSKEKPEYVSDEALFFKIVRAAFGQRRKTLLNALNAVFGSQLKKSEIAGAITSCGFNESIRGETLGIEEFAAISNAFTLLL